VFDIRKIKENTTLIPIIIIFSLLLITNNYFYTTNFVYGQPDQIKPNIHDITKSLTIQNIPVKKVHVGDIDMAYRIFGKGDGSPYFLLISGATSSMQSWEPSLVRNLSSNHTVIIFDNRGVGNTTSGIKPFSIQQFANDTAGLLDALKIQQADVLGFSMGSFVAQQLTVMHPEKVNRLVLYGASCGGKEAIPHSPQFVKMAMDVINKLGKGTSIDPQELKTFLSQQLGAGWMKLHPNFFETIPIPKFAKFTDLFPGIPRNTEMQQTKSVQSWMSTNWSGICDNLSKISNPTLVITGTDDVVVPSANSLIIAEKIPGAWLVQIKDAGHALMSQYPYKFNKVLQTFLSITTTRPS
jgi:pimeloyl-ACP methyl ester carboxylesterase